MGKSEDGRYYMVRGNWDPSSRGFKELIHLNEETPKGMKEEDSIEFRGKTFSFPFLSLSIAEFAFYFCMALDKHRIEYHLFFSLTTDFRSSFLRSPSLSDDCTRSCHQRYSRTCSIRCRS